MVGGEADKIKTICSFVLEDDVVCEKPYLSAVRQRK